MTCDEFRDRYTDFHDGDLPLAEEARCRAHLSACPSCARYDRILQRGLGLVRELPVCEPSAEFQPRLRNRLYELQNDAIRGRSVATAAISACIGVAITLAAVVWSPFARPDLFRARDVAAAPAPPSHAPVRASLRSPFTVPVAAPTPEYWADPAPGSGSVYPVGLSVRHTPTLYSPVIVAPPAYHPGDAVWVVNSYIE